MRPTNEKREERMRRERKRKDRGKERNLRIDLKGVGIWIGVTTTWRETRREAK